MNRQNVIVVIAPTLEVWGNFKKLCEAKGFDVLPYHSLKSKPFPIIHNVKVLGDSARLRAFCQTRVIRWGGCLTET